MTPNRETEDRQEQSGAAWLVARFLCRWFGHNWRSLAPEGYNAWVCVRCDARHGDSDLFEVS